jgi:benzil reductase ((S)-benzoin forming)
LKKGLLITGGNKGLGKALIDLALKDPDIKIISISRSLHEDHLNVTKNKMVLIPKDLSSLKNVEKELSLEKYYNTITEELVFINNAATIFPIKKIGDFEEKEILNNIQVNTATSILLTNHLLRYKMNQKVKILNISSGAGQRPILGWSLYCSMKAANEMFFNTLKLQESTKKEIEVYNVSPGIMDTGMQKKIRNVDVTVMPDVIKFKGYHENDQLKNPMEVALMLNESYNLFNHLL